MNITELNPVSTWRPGSCEHCMEVTVLALHNSDCLCQHSERLPQSKRIARVTLRQGVEALLRGVSHAQLRCKRTTYTDQYSHLSETAFQSTTKSTDTT